VNPGLLTRPSWRRHFQAATERRLRPQPSAAEVARLQMAAIQRTWADAVADIPYYSRLVASGAAPAVCRDWTDLARVPVLTRQLLQERPHDFIRLSGPPATFASTAGSTGTPLRIGMNQAERDLMRVVKVAAWQDFGYTLSSRLFLIWGHAHLLGTGWRGRVNHWRRKAADAVIGYHRVDAYRLNRAACEAHAEALLRFRPLGVIGYSSALDLFARYCSQYRDRFRALGVRFVLSTAEAPPRPDTIATLEDLFGCPVVEEYGGAEFGQVAFRRQPQAFDVFHDLNYVEAEAPEPDSNARPLLVTTLYPRYLPLIRYRPGDAVRGAELLPHGHVTRFQAVVGRVNDVIHLANGDAIHSVAIFHCIHQEQDVQSIQMVLRDDGIAISLVAFGGDQQAIAARVRARLAQVHPTLAEAQVRFVEDQLPGRAGKRRWYVDHRTTTSCAASPAS
jgi:phenylacetate-CoA ligase